MSRACLFRSLVSQCVRDASSSRPQGPSMAAMHSPARVGEIAIVFVCVCGCYNPRHTVDRVINRYFLLSHDA